jgi:hypothetical protein
MVMYEQKFQHEFRSAGGVVCCGHNGKLNLSLLCPTCKPKATATRSAVLRTAEEERTVMSVVRDGASLDGMTPAERLRRALTPTPVDERMDALRAMELAREPVRVASPPDRITQKVRAAHMSDLDMRHGLDRVLRARVAGFVGIEAVYATDLAVVYATAIQPEAIVLYRQTFTIGADTLITLNDDAQRVQSATTYTAASGSAPPPIDLQARLREKRGWR